MNAMTREAHRPFPQAADGGGYFLPMGGVTMVENQYQAWMTKQIRTSIGERRRRLREGHGHAEKLFAQTVWLPAAGQYEHLNAEYEVSDFRDGVRFIDLAYLRPPHKIAIEIDGFGPHARNIDRRSFSDSLMRQNHLVLDGWMVLRFSYDDVKDHPRTCQQIILQMLGRMYGGQSTLMDLPLKLREILRHASYISDPITPADVCLLLGVANKHARDLLQQLVSLGYLAPNGGEHRTRSYKRVERSPY
jgi:very-short-patch-repair endonuclease